uniref:Secreted protein n=1 Tax=Pyxicephalus adspersus TaxID=30357 RepID=A0AAV3A2U7_PYXAD|nr:TPA: hypothetical protein GDO54_012852 [Pyxicephalus adspersus]
MFHCKAKVFMPFAMLITVPNIGGCYPSTKAHSAGSIFNSRRQFIVAFCMSSTFLYFYVSTPDVSFLICISRCFHDGLFLKLLC